jgi:hypothetical protein
MVRAITHLTWLRFNRRSLEMRLLWYPGEFLIFSAKRLLQQYRHEADKSWRTRDVGFEGVKRTGPDDRLKSAVDPDQT